MSTLFLVGVSEARELALQNGVYRLGRDASSDLRLSDPSISGFHCEIEVTEGRARVRDLGSTNGTYVEDRRVSESEVQLNERLRLGDVELRLQAEPTRISVPELVREEAVLAPILPNGGPACVGHLDLAAVYQCTRCPQTWCEACVRRIGRVGGKALRFCPQCNGSCVVIEWEDPASRKSPWRRLAEGVARAFQGRPKKGRRRRRR